MSVIDVTRIGSSLLTAAACAVSLSACSVAGPRQSPLPHEGPTMVEIYERHMQEERSAPAREPRPLRPSVPETQPVSSPLVNRFQRLPNPDLEMLVFAHLAGGRHPVPEYVTVFPMYETVQYALPGEVAPREASVQADAAAWPSTNWLAMLDTLSPPTHQVAIDFSADYAQRCGNALPAGRLPELLGAMQRDARLHDLERRRVAFAIDGPTGPAYQKQRAELSCSDIAAALREGAGVALK